MHALPASWGVAARALRAVPDWIRKLIKAWLVWFWRLGTVAKIVATGVEIVCLWLALPHIPLAQNWRPAAFQFGSIGLAFLCIAGILFSNPGRVS
jgi:hypothetical protein